MHWVMVFIGVSVSGIFALILSQHLIQISERDRFRDESERDKSLEYMKGQMASLVQFYSLRGTSSDLITASLPIPKEKEHETPEQTLGRKCAILSKDMFTFLQEWGQKEPPSPKRETWSEDVDKSIRLSQERMLDYSRNFGGRVISLHDQLAELGIRDNEIDRTYEHPTNPIGVKILAERFGAIAEKIKR